MEDKIREGLELLRLAHNNMSRPDYHVAVHKLCQDGNLRYPLMDAGQTATITHLEAIENLEEESDDNER